MILLSINVPFRRGFSFAIIVTMKILEQTYKTTGTLHHAYFIVGDPRETVPKLSVFFEKSLRIAISGNPDFLHRKFDVISVDEARQLSFSQEVKDLGGKRKIFILEANSITEQAQNALLKVFEEPTAGTHFFLVMPQDNLLPTLRSRLHIILHTDENEEKNLLTISKMNMSERMGLVKEVVDGIKDEEKTKQDAVDLVNKIERSLYMKGVASSEKSLKLCESARSSLFDNGAPVKMILENLLLSI